MSRDLLGIEQTAEAAEPKWNFVRRARSLFAAQGVALFAGVALLLIASHATLLRLPYFWDEAGYYIPAARDLLAGSLVPHSTPSNAHPPLVMAWLALAWKLFGQGTLVTRCAMLVLAAFTLTGYFRLATRVSNRTVATASTVLVALYPVFFAQSSLAQVDLPAAGLAFWGMESYVRRRSTGMILWFSLAALAKETAILVPLGLLLWEVIQRVRSRQFAALSSVIPLAVPVLPLAAWYVYHYLRTGFVFGNPEFFRYNVLQNLHPLRIFLALLLRLWQTVGYLNLYVVTVACLIAMRYSPQELKTRRARKGTSPDRAADNAKPRIDSSIQFAFLTVSLLYVAALSTVGGAVLARYMLPIVPLFILVCVSTIWRRLKAWNAVLAVVAAGFLAALIVNPPYGFSPEDNLAYSDYIRLHQTAENFIETRLPHARVLTAWPASDELSRPYLGYVARPMQVVRIEDFTAEQLFSAAEMRSQFDVALVFSTKYQLPHSLFDRWSRWQIWKARYFGYHVDMPPQAAAAVLGGNVIYADSRNGQWVGVIRIDRVEEAHTLGLPRMH